MVLVREARIEPTRQHMRNRESRCGRAAGEKRGRLATRGSSAVVGAPIPNGTSEAMASMVRRISLKPTAMPAQPTVRKSQRLRRSSARSWRTISSALTRPRTRRKTVWPLPSPQGASDARRRPTGVVNAPDSTTGTSALRVAWTPRCIAKMLTPSAGESTASHLTLMSPTAGGGG
eukprot:scaffold69855_cov27-Tisochrysis_lutea.AAC.2